MLNVIPWESLFGGILLGISATILLLVNGKIAGISGIMNGIMSPKKGDYSWRLLFAVGMIAGGLISVLMLGVAVPSTANLSLGMVIAAGLLVGIGPDWVTDVLADTAFVAWAVCLSALLWRPVYLWPSLA